METNEISIERVQYLLEKGNLPQAEMLCRIALETEPQNPVFFYFLSLIANALNLRRFSEKYLKTASELAPDWDLPHAALTKLGRLPEEEKARNSIGNEDHEKKFLLIKAWGYGFWSDVDHVLCQLLIADITKRIPVIHWGINSLFGDASDKNAFEFYFDRVSDFMVDDLAHEDYDFFPPKWNCKNLREENVNKWAGFYSRMSGLYSWNRQEKVVVSDFYTGLISLRPWIPSDHYLYGISIDGLYRFLIQKYLHPKKEILDEIECLYVKDLSSSKFMSVHVRGSDKIHEVANLCSLNEQYFEIINAIGAVYRDYKIFLMTDDSRLLGAFLRRYGNRIVTTACQRTDQSTGIHYQSDVNRRRLGVEVMIDTYLAAKGDIFIGNGRSNPSTIVLYLKDWNEKNIYLIGHNMHHCFNTILYDG
jgi:protein O-GlcNAc transferase